ncbi:MAG: SpoIID/LytB domain-containing protein [Propionibacteriales bacterium]|nr:SpoIID/LytB domain-containing protein [Propionibacteriales bacterium]
MTTRIVRAAMGRLAVGVGLAALTVPVAVVMGVGTVAGGQTYYVPVTKSWTIHGHGYGHGHGMSQYGAQGAALSGLSFKKIINFYYPGTAWSAVRGTVRVLISSDTTSDVQVRPRSGLRVRDMRDNASWKLPTRAGVDRWRLNAAPDDTTAVQYHNAKGWHRWRIPDGRTTFKSNGQFSASGPLTLLVPSGSGVDSKRVRGALRSVRPYAGATFRDTVNVLSMDAYVQGVVPYEMPASWHQQALRAQSVAARTYAAWQRAQNPRRYYQICDTTACQVYGGVGAEQPSSNTAVQATAGKILTYKSRPAFTQFSSSSGGWTSAGSVPYLPAKRDPYDDFEANGVHDWKVTVNAATLERAHPEIGRLKALRVTRRDGHGEWNGRALQIVLDGTQGSAYLTGDDFRWEYGLRSTWFTIEPTPIVVRWRQLGGAKSPLGRPVSAEYALSAGSAQDFEAGRVFWSSSTGAREVRGRLLAAYREWGGPTSNLGWPVTGVLTAAEGGYKVRMQGGRIFTKRGPGAHVLYGPVLRHWGKKKGPAGWLGYPTTDVHRVVGGHRARFQHGVITWDRSTDTFKVVKTS